jgi:hypothetical protein
MQATLWRRAAAAILLAGLAQGAMAQSKPSDKPLATRDLDVQGVVAEVIESDRRDGVLTVRVRLRNEGDKPAKVSLVGNQGYIDTYIVAGNTKYQLMQDTSGRQAATPRDGGGWLEPTIRPKGNFTWWGKFPAPPGNSYSLYLKVGPPIDGVPIIDK